MKKDKKDLKKKEEEEAAQEIFKATKIFGS